MDRHRESADRRGNLRLGPVSTAMFTIGGRFFPFVWNICVPSSNLLMRYVDVKSIYWRCLSGFARLRPSR